MSNNSFYRSFASGFGGFAGSGFDPFFGITIGVSWLIAEIVLFVYKTPGKTN